MRAGQKMLFLLLVAPPADVPHVAETRRHGRMTPVAGGAMWHARVLKLQQAFPVHAPPVLFHYPRAQLRIGHVAGMPSRRKVYRLTSNGEGIARSLRNRALARTVAIMFEDGRVESLPGPQALEALRRRGVAEGRSVLLILTRGRIDLRQPGLRRAPLPPPHGRVLSAEARARAAFDAAFVRPYAWQLEVVLGPPHVPPVAVAA